MAKFYYLLVIGLLFLSACSDKPTDANILDKAPNVILVITDDQGYGDLGHTGNAVIKTPALDLFSAESVNLTNYHVGTTCAPTRAGLLTGRNCNRNGVWHTIMGASILNEDEVTMADMLRANGYATGMFGKWHLGDNHPFLPHDRGFDTAFYHGGGGVGQTPDYWNNDYFDDTYFRNGVPEKQSGYCTDIWFDEAITFIENKKQEPFFCYLSLNAPHGPYNVPENYYDLYKEQEIPEVQKRFYGMISNIDDNFSKLLTKLNEWGLTDNTIVIFTTDNGTARGYQVDRQHGQVFGFNAGMRGTKGSEYDGGHRVPLMIRWPKGGLSGGKKLDGLTAHVDMLPTLATLTGQSFTPAKTMDGTDISGYLLDKTEVPARMLVTDTQRVPWPKKGKNSCVMENDWRLIKGRELYNISDDPGQETDLADQFPERVQRMNDFYDSWWADVIAETKLSAIALGQAPLEVLTCHDARTTDQIPPWNQRMIRQGKPMIPAKFIVKFVAAGKYKFSLRRWPAESGLALGAAPTDAVAATPFTDGRIDGQAMAFSKAYLKIGDQEYTSELENTAGAAVIEAEVPVGETELLAYFDLEDGTQSNAFYVYVERMDGE